MLKTQIVLVIGVTKLKYAIVIKLKLCCVPVHHHCVMSGWCVFTKRNCVAERFPIQSGSMQSSASALSPTDQSAGSQQHLCEIFVSQIFHGTSHFTVNLTSRLAFVSVSTAELRVASCFRPGSISKSVFAIRAVNQQARYDPNVEVVDEAYSQRGQSMQGET